MISLGCTQRDARHHLPPPHLPHIQNPIHLCKIHFEVLQTQKPGERCTPLKTTVNLQQLEISSQGSRLFFHHAGSGDQTRVFRLGHQPLYQLSPLTGPTVNSSSLIL